MIHLFKPAITFLANSTTFRLIEEGFSTDEKWNVDDQHLLRFSSKEQFTKLQQQAELTNAVHEKDGLVPYVYEVGLYENRAYTILDYRPGENGEVMLPRLSKEHQYKIGIQVGETLKRMHSIEAPADYPAWETVWRERLENQAPLFEEIVARNPSYSCILPFIHKQLHLLHNRPSCVQHFDFHPGNILIQDNRFTGLIDMQKIRYADPINEFYKMEYFNVPVSIPYAIGVVDGYHAQQPIPSTFWELHRLYAAMHLVFAEVWGHAGGIAQLEKFQSFTRFTIEQFQDFSILVPRWYSTS